MQVERTGFTRSWRPLWVDWELAHVLLAPNHPIAHPLQLQLILGGHDHHYEITRSEPHGTLVFKSGTDFREFSILRVGVPPSLAGKSSQLVIIARASESCSVLRVGVPPTCRVGAAAALVLFVNVELDSVLDSRESCAWAWPCFPAWRVGPLAGCLLFGRQVVHSCSRMCRPAAG